MTLKNDAERPYQTQLRQLLAEHFSLDELRTLCQDIDVDFDELGGENKTAKTGAMLAEAERRLVLLLSPDDCLTLFDATTCDQRRYVQSPND